MTRVVEAAREHAQALVGRLRPSDVREIAAAIGGDPDAAMLRCWETSEVRWAGLVEGRVVCVFGVVRPTALSSWGMPWLLGSSELNRWATGLELCRRTGEYVREMRERFDLLQNYVDVRQHRSIHWLRWSGFHVEPAEVWGVEGRPFSRFWVQGGSDVPHRR